MPRWGVELVFLKLLLLNYGQHEVGELQAVRGPPRPLPPLDRVVSRPPLSLAAEKRMRGGKSTFITSAQRGRALAKYRKDDNPSDRLALGQSVTLISTLL
jgi:hypothetical protein